MDVCIAIDANKALETNNQLFHEWIAECRLVSVHENLYDKEYYEAHPIPSTYQYREKKLDHVFCTPWLFGCVTVVLIEPLHDGLFSDHRALIVDFDTAQLLSQMLHIAKPKTRLLVSTRKKAMQQYRIELDYRLTAQNIYQRATKLIATYKKEKEHMLWMENQVKTLDNYITTCMLAAQATIHCHNLEISVQKSGGDKHGKVLEVGSTSQQRQQTSTNNPNGNITNYPNMDTSGMHNKLAILEELHVCKENYRQAIAKGKELWHEFLLERAEIAANNNNQTLKTAIKQLAHIEVLIQTYVSI
jgi:hypothetical protein